MNELPELKCCCGSYITFEITNPGGGQILYMKHRGPIKAEAAIRLVTGHPILYQASFLSGTMIGRLRDAGAPYRCVLYMQKGFDVLNEMLRG